MKQNDLESFEQLVVHVNYAFWRHFDCDIAYAEDIYTSSNAYNYDPN